MRYPPREIVPVWGESNRVTLSELVVLLMCGLAFVTAIIHIARLSEQRCVKWEDHRKHGYRYTGYQPRCMQWEARRAR